MKLNHLSKSVTLTEDESLLTELDSSAGEELDGKDSSQSDSTISLDDVLNGSSEEKAATDHSAPVDDMPASTEEPMVAKAPAPHEIQKNANSGYTLGNVSSQLDGIVKNWFQFAVSMQPDEKERFLALGERLSEISDLIKSEFA